MVCFFIHFCWIFVMQLGKIFFNFVLNCVELLVNLLPFISLLYKVLLTVLKMGWPFQAHPVPLSEEKSEINVFEIQLEPLGSCKHGALLCVQVF